ncbi:MAG: Gfo/Idh/MocA family protein [Terriglobia bacterium]
MATSKQIGYAVVGLGGIAQRAVLPGFRHSKKAKLVALVSGGETKAKRLARKFGARDTYTYDEYGECLANPAVDAVYLASPNGCHMQQTLQAAAAGKHVLCEKPMANTAADCRAMIEACRRQRVRLMIAYRKYFEPGSLALKKLVTSGRLGRLRVIHSAFTIMLPPGKAEGWRFDPALAGGGALPDLGIYCVNTVRWLTGLDPVEAEAYAWITDASRFNEAIDQHVAFRLNFPGGLVLQATASFGAAQASFLRVHGERGWAALDPAYAYDEERRLFGKTGGRWFEKGFPVMDEFALELDAFAECILKRRDPEPDGIQGLRDVAVMQAIYQAARARRAVPVVIPE